MTSAGKHFKGNIKIPILGLNDPIKTKSKNRPNLRNKNLAVQERRTQTKFKLRYDIDSQKKC